MGVRMNSLVGLACVVALSGIVTPAKAQDVSTATTTFRREPLNDRFDRVYYGVGGDYSAAAVSIAGQAQTIIGPIFPEIAASKDAQDLEKLFREQLYRQVATDPIIRTADLPNPYNSSLLTQPSSSFSTQSQSGNLVIEAPGMR